MAGEMNNFLESMTFAQRDCDCDECGIGGLGNGPPMKSAVEEAFDKYRSSTNYAVSSRHQERKLIRREEDMNTGLVVTLYSMSLPVGALPLLEYGDSARIVFVIGLPKVIHLLRFRSHLRLHRVYALIFLFGAPAGYSDFCNHASRWKLEEANQMET